METNKNKTHQRFGKHLYKCLFQSFHAIFLYKTNNVGGLLLATFANQSLEIII